MHSLFNSQFSWPKIISVYYRDSRYSYKYYKAVNCVNKYNLTVCDMIIPFVFFVARVMIQ